MAKFRIKKLIVPFLAIGLSAAATFSMSASAAPVNVIKNSDFSSTSEWKTRDDEGNPVDNPIQISDGTAKITEETTGWSWLYQEVTVKKNTKYGLYYSINLSKGQLQLVVFNPDNPDNKLFEGYTQVQNDGKYGEWYDTYVQQTINTGDYDKLLVVIKAPDGDSKGIGELDNVQLLELGADGNPIDDGTGSGTGTGGEDGNDEGDGNEGGDITQTGVVFPVALVGTALASSGVLVAVRKKRS